MRNDRDDPRFFPPQVALYLVKIACERPDMMERSLSQWDCTELAHQVVAAKIAGSISASTVRRILNSHKLKPWRHHLWLSPKAPRDEAFVKSIKEISSLYTRSLNVDEMVLCVDEKTNLQPRPRKSKTLPAKPELPVRVEHEYERKGHLISLLHLILGLVKYGGRLMSVNVKKNLLYSLNIWTSRFPHQLQQFMWC